MHTASPSFQTTARPPLRWPGWIFNTLLTILFLGPIAAPLFRATGLPGVADLGLLAQVLLNTYICPTPAWAYEVAGYPMAVCARCWGATIGLWAARLMLVPGMHSQSWWADGLRGYRALPLPNRLLLSAAPVVLWPIEIIGTYQGWWQLPPLWVLLLNGAQAGFFAGLFFASVWPGFWPRSAPRLHTGV